MVDYNLINSLGDLDSEVDSAVATALGDAATDLSKLVSGDEVQDFTPGAILKGKVSSVSGDDFVVELGLKSEGILERSEFDEPDNVKIGDEVRVLLEDVEGDTGMVRISKRKADRIINWEAIMKSKKEGDPVSGKVTKKIKGGLLVDIGVPVFLPASQVDIRRPGEISDWIGRSIDAVILKIDEDKEKIALGLKQKDASPWENIETKYAVGSVHEATVVNIMSYGAFCKLEEGVEGLVHISEMSWTKRINHPSEIVAPEQKVKVKVLEINKDKQEISLGMKQVEENPWERVAEKYTH